MQTLYFTDIVRATGLSRMTLWRSFKGQEPLYVRDTRGKRFAAADVISRLRQRGGHNPQHETALLAIDRERRQQHSEANT